MPKKDVPRPTERELAILAVLWDRGPSTVRQVNEAMAPGQRVGYTTTLKLMQIMAEKGLLLRNESARTHIYRAAIGEEQTQRQLVGDMLEKVFAGSAEKLVMRALAAGKVTAKELTRIREILDKAEGKK
jgi:predicted transcriptional regulator